MNIPIGKKVTKLLNPGKLLRQNGANRDFFNPEEYIDFKVCGRMFTRARISPQIFVKYPDLLKVN